MADALLTGLSALQAHQRAMEVTSHNLANAATPGYSRQRAELAAPVPEQLGAGLVGRGVDVVSVRRTADALVIERVRQSHGETGRLTTLGTTLGAVEAAFNEPGDQGLSATLDQLFATMQDLTSNPESLALRSGVVSGLQTVAGLITSVGGRIADLQDDLRNQIADQITQINGLTSEIAGLNVQIRREVLVGNAPNDFLDRREQLLNQLSALVDGRVRLNDDGAATFEINGSLLIGVSSAQQLVASRDGAGGVSVVFAGNGTALTVTGGKLGAALSLDREIMPAFLDRLDSLAGTIIRELNAAHATGTSPGFVGERFVAERSVDSANADLDLDDVRNALADGGRGIPALFAPSFTDADGVAETRNLTINVLDRASGIAHKSIVRYDPGPNGDAGRSLQDLVDAIVSGRGGGFSVHPPGSTGGIDGLTARLLPVDGGLKLELIAEAGKSIDFSPALDTRPSATAWTGGQVAVSGSSVALAGRRLVVEVDGSGDLELFTTDPATGARTPFPGPGTTTVAVGATTTVGGVTIAAAAGSYRTGESFSVDFDELGAVVTKGATAGTHTQGADWTFGDADLTLRGRYTGGLAFDPAQPWTMRVLSGGTIGDDDAPPVVEFAFLVEEDGAVQTRTVQRTLDSSALDAPVTIGEGVFVQFSAGNLTTGNRLELVVDGQPDQAGLLPALGINGLFTGTGADSIAVAQRLLDDPAQLAAGRTRVAGDNSNAVAFGAVRGARVLGNGTASFDDFYQSLVSDVGVQVDQNRRLAENQELVAATLENQRDQVSGVSIDEEVGRLILQQQAFNAAARVITAAKENIDVLMNVLN